MKNINAHKPRRTFAIISHPDAGKTTITESLLYHGGVIHQQGEVKAKAGRKFATSDWMKVEQERGISISSAVMQFEFNGFQINLLDTPGHKDFSEDTYRTLIAVDSALMLIDGAKGVEDRTKKLYEVCKYRQIPIFTFVNKMDRESKPTLELMDEIERTLGMSCAPATWPIGSGSQFYGVYDRRTKEIIPFKGHHKVSCEISELDQIATTSEMSREAFLQAKEELDLVEGALLLPEKDRFLSGEISPVMFGSAKEDFGIHQFLELFVELAPSPLSRKLINGEILQPDFHQFNALVFKIQANMDKRHRDRVAFARICSGRFERGMKVYNARTGREMRLAYSHQFIGQERTTVDEAFAGDIIGINDTGNLLVGDSLCEGKMVQFEDIPRFTPELFARILVGDAMKRKQLQKGISQLSEEGTIQLFMNPHIGLQEPIVGVVGELQFEILIHRLKDEYNLDAKLEKMPYSVARWPKQNKKPYHGDLKGTFPRLVDMRGEPVVLLEKEWDLNWVQKENPNIEFSTLVSAQR